MTLEKVKEALEYYADEENYEPVQTLNGERPAPILKMRNSLAQKALKEFEQLRSNILINKD